MKALTRLVAGTLIAAAACGAAIVGDCAARAQAPWVATRSSMISGTPVSPNSVVYPSSPTGSGYRAYQRTAYEQPTSSGSRFVPRPVVYQGPTVYQNSPPTEGQIVYSEDPHDPEWVAARATTSVLTRRNSLSQPGAGNSLSEGAATETLPTPAMRRSGSAVGSAPGGYPPRREGSGIAAPRAYPGTYQPSMGEEIVGEPGYLNGPGYDWVGPFGFGWGHGEGACGEGGGCGQGEGGCGQCGGCLIPCPHVCMRNIQLFTGVQGFTGPPNLASTGSFGFHEGINWSNRLPCMPCRNISMQIGARFTQNNLDGADFTPDSRTQTFLTGGLFRRVDCGLQGGVVLDYLNDDWYVETELLQLRAEVSWVYPECHEIGLWVATSLRTADVTWVTEDEVGDPVTVTELRDSTDMYLAFYRRRFADCRGGAGRLYAGFTGYGDGLFGGDILLPINGPWALQSEFMYLAPNRTNYAEGPNRDESWNVSISVVWYPRAGREGWETSARPLFDVAGNGTMMIKRR
jgi:hypothetical protein